MPKIRLNCGALQQLAAVTQAQGLLTCSPSIFAVLAGGDSRPERIMIDHRNPARPLRPCLLLTASPRLVYFVAILQDRKRTVRYDTGMTG